MALTTYSIAAGMKMVAENRKYAFDFIPFSCILLPERLVGGQFTTMALIHIGAICANGTGCVKIAIGSLTWSTA